MIILILFYGSNTFLNIGFTFQPSEIIKFAMIAYIADFLARRQDDLKYFFRGFVPVMLVFGLVCGLILIQPDLGTVLLISMVSFLMFFCGGIRFSYLLGSFLCSLPLLYKFVLGVAYRRKRILSFLNPWEDPQGISFQIVQSFIALGSGGLFGVGLGESKQKLFYLPEAHTDFIFSIIGEELGFLACILILSMFLLFFILGFRISFKAVDLRAHFFALGIVIMIFLQAVINMGVVSGFFPTKGMPLPFISFGGTNLVVMMFSVGVLFNISKLQDKVRENLSVSKKGKRNKKIDRLLAKPQY
ncbi:FtsW/RodA/SpoVE family cell cycle protein [Candidatus Auribacterota bacterium]